MIAWQIALLAMSLYLIIAFAIGLSAGRGRSFFSISEYAVGDLVYLLCGFLWEEQYFLHFLS